MPRRISIELDNGRSFLTQKEAKEFFKQILQSKTKIEKSSAEYSDVISLYRRHPEFDKKSQNEENILYFIVKNSGEYDSRCFHTVHQDGSQTDWSYKKAIEGKGETKFQRFTDGARHILERENYFRDAAFTEKCRKFIEERGYSVDNFPEDWVSLPMNSQYRATLLAPIKNDFINWYKNLEK